MFHSSRCDCRQTGREVFCFTSSSQRMCGFLHALHMQQRGLGLCKHRTESLQVQNFRDQNADARVFKRACPSCNIRQT